MSWQVGRRLIDRYIVQDKLFIDLLDGEGDLIGAGGKEGMGFDQAGEADGGKTEGAQQVDGLIRRIDPSDSSS